MNLSIIILFISVIAFSGCATPAYRQVLQEKTSYNSKEYNVPMNVLHRAVSRAICAKNFIIEQEDAGKGFILAKRSFQERKKTVVLVLQAKMDPVGNDKTTLYLNALETTESVYVADRTRFFLFLIPLPGGGGKNATQVKEGEKVINDKKFYNSFFKEIEREAAVVSASVEKEKVVTAAQAVEKPQAALASPVQETAENLTTKE